jgi:DNA-binding CsgD family transcriptional regulator
LDFPNKNVSYFSQNLEMLIIFTNFVKLNNQNCPMSGKPGNSKAIVKPIKNWAINKRTSQKTLEYATNMLRAFSRLQGCEYYLINYYEQKLHITDSSAIMLCGYSQQEAEDLGFGFYEKIIEPTEWKWLLDYNEKGFEFFFNLDIPRRKDALVSYTMKLLNVSGMEINTLHEVTPLELDENGNPWFMLCRITITTDNYTQKAYIIDKKTGERWDLINGKFRKSDAMEVTEDELKIIRYLIAGHTVEKIVEFLNISTRTFSRRLDVLYKKMGVSTKSALVHKAGLYGLM